MENQMNNTVTEIVTPSGETIRVTLNFLLLYRVKAKYPEAYKKYNKVMMENMDDIFDGMNILYTGYLCALPEGEEAKKYEDFIALFEDDVQGVMREALKLLGRKKKAASVTPS